MDLMLDTPLDQIGRQAHAHYQVAEKHNTKAEENYKSAGLYLKAAKLRVLKTRGLTWERWLKDNCPISRRRADEVIMIADGRVSEEDLRERKAQSMRDTRARRADEKNERHVAPDRPEKPNENNAPHKESIIEEAESLGDKALRERRQRIKAQIDTLDCQQLTEIEKALFQCSK